MIIEKEHKKETLMNKTKKELVEHIMCLEHNNNVLHETLEQQAKNFETLEKAAYNKGWNDCKNELKKKG